MSLVEIIEHDEVIYTILDKPPPEPPKTPRKMNEEGFLNTIQYLNTVLNYHGCSLKLNDYLRDIYRGKVVETVCVISGAPSTTLPRYQSKLEKELKETKKPELRRTFGYAETPLDPPGDFLKKGHGIGQPIKKSDHKCYVSGNLPPVPKRPPPGKGPEKPKINFRVQNIKKAIQVKSKLVEPRLVDTRDGHIKKIKGSGEVPEFCLRPDFGQMPAYLVKRNRKIQKRLDKIRYAQENKESLCKLISEQERQKLLDELKQNWQLMQKAFLQLPMLTDTIPKILKKTKMENELRQLEKDIALVESNPYIYIY